MTPSRLLVVLLGLVLALAACGDDEGGGGSGAEEEITEVLTRGLTTEEPAVTCEQTMSESLMRRIYGSAARCREIEADSDDKPATSVDVTNIEVDGENATATVAVTGGDQSGSKGPVELVDQDGDWRVNELSAETLRSQLQAGLKNDTDIPQEAKGCIQEKVLALDDAELQELAYGAIGEKPAATRQLVGYFTQCDKPADGQSALRKRFEQGVAESMKKDGNDQKTIDCVLAELRERITDQEIGDLAAAQGEDLSAEVREDAEAAYKECGAS